MILSKYQKGISFFFLQMLISCTNDIISKFTGQRLDAVEVTFFRFFFGLITLLPFILTQKASVFKTKQLGLNLFRGMLGAASFFLYIDAVIILPLSEIVTILWTIPLFSIVLSIIFLNENVSKYRWFATLIGFAGLVVITSYNSNSSFHFNKLYLIPISAALLFALQDIVIKKMVTASESRLTMLFYFALITSAVMLFPTVKVWKTPTTFELTILFLLGIGGNLIQYFIFKAFSLIDVSAVAPYRYLELLISALMAFVFFFELPGINVYIGALILIPSTLYLGYTENKRKKKQTASGN